MNRLTIAALLLACAAGVAHADTRETQRMHLDEYAPYLQAPVDEFPFWSLYKWQLVAPDKVVVWSTINDAYLVTVAEPCAGLEWARDIGVISQQPHRISRRFDYVTFGRERCHIEEIRPIDSARMRQDRRAAGQ